MMSASHERRRSGRREVIEETPAPSARRQQGEPGELSLVMTQQRKLALRRLLAVLVDYGFMALFVAVLTGAGFAIRGLLGVTPSPLTTFPQKLLAQAIVVATVTLPIVLYFAVSESSRWQATIGKRVLRLQVTADRGGRPRLPRTLLRTVAKFAPGSWRTPASGMSPARRSSPSRRRSTTRSGSRRCSSPSGGLRRSGSATGGRRTTVSRERW